jgi:hypothetical protein
MKFRLKIANCLLFLVKVSDETRHQQKPHIGQTRQVRALFSLAQMHKQVKVGLVVVLDQERICLLACRRDLPKNQPKLVIKILLLHFETVFLFV